MGKACQERPIGSIKKGKPHRDFRKFIIIAEGEREDEYFLYFQQLSQRVVIEIVPRIGGKSAVKYLLERVSNYEYQKGIESEDQVWFVLDVDNWPKKAVNDLIQNCKETGNWNIAISNPCFEVWLHYHLLEKIPAELNSAKKLKANLNLIISGGYNRDKFAELIQDASTNASKADLNKRHPFPDLNVSKVYLLADQLLKFLGKRRTFF